nr:hypothetical protein [uncultured Roseococcus sp.]
MARWEEDHRTGRWEIFQNKRNHGWIEWRGGSPPVTDGEVDVRLRSGRIIFYRSPVGIGGRQNAGGGWVHLGERGDIIAYRRHAQAVYEGDPSEILPF